MDFIDKIILGDATVRLTDFPAASTDLIVTDPPYGMAYQSSWRTDKHAVLRNDHSIEWFPSFAAHAYRVLKDNTHIYVFCNDYAISDFRRELQRVGFTPKRTLVWVKNNHTSGDLAGDYGNKTEFIIYAQKGRRKLNDNRATNVLNFDRALTDLHPTQKPEDLIAFLILKSSDLGDLVLDPFLGSGTTCVAAKTLGRHYCGIEMDGGYYHTAVHRIARTSIPHPT